MSEKKQLSSQTDSSDLSLGRCPGDFFSPLVQAELLGILAYFYAKAKFT